MALLQHISVDAVPSLIRREFLLNFHKTNTFKLQFKLDVGRLKQETVDQTSSPVSKSFKSKHAIIDD